MSYTVSVAESGKYILVAMKGPVDAELALEFNVRARDLARQHNIHGFLFDAREAANVDSAFRNYMFTVKDMEQLELDKSARSAILISAGDHSHDFIEAFAPAAGFNVRMFDDPAAAVAWLEETR